MIDICHSCLQPIEFSFRDKNIPYWKHINNKSCTVDYGIHPLHNIVKDFLIRYIANGNTIEFFHNCTPCGSTLLPSLCIEDLNIIIKKDIPYTSPIGEKHILDIAGVYANGQVVFGIDVYCKFKSETSFANMGIHFFEIRACDVIAVAFIKPLPNKLTLRHYRNSSACNASGCMLIRDMAIALGYLEIKSQYVCEARKIIDEVVLKGYLPDIEVWNSRGITDDSTIKDLFLATKRCMKCEYPYETTEEKPFCNNCRIHTQHLVKSSYLIDSDRWQSLRQDLSWINDLPDKWKFNYCYLCHRNYKTDEENNLFPHLWETGTKCVRVYTKWFNKYKPVCTVCLDEKIRAQGLIN